MAMHKVLKIEKAQLGDLLNTAGDHSGYSARSAPKPNRAKSTVQQLEGQKRSHFYIISGPEQSHLKHDIKIFSHTR